MKINLLEEFDVLEKAADRVFEPAEILEEMRQLQTAYDMKYHSGKRYVRGNNGVSGRRFHWNGAWLENEIKALNPELHYIEDNHGILNTEVAGNGIPDYEYRINGKRYTLESKTYKTLENFNATTYFEGADYCIAFVMTESRFYFRKSINGYVYTKAMPMADLPEALKPIIGWIKLPEEVKMIRLLNVNDGMSDGQVPETVRYTVDLYKVIEG